MGYFFIGILDDASKVRESGLAVQPYGLYFPKHNLSIKWKQHMMKNHHIGTQDM